MGLGVRSTVRWRWWLLTLVLALTLLLTCADGQTTTCSASIGCFPPSGVELTGAGYPARSVQVSSTCGDGSTPTGSEPYRSLAPTDGTNYTCLTSNHTKALMTDDVVGMTGQPDLTTYWQSPNTVMTQGGAPVAQTVVVNLTDVFLITGIMVYFIAPNGPQNGLVTDARPKEMLIEKWDQSSGTWVKLRAFAENCIAFPNLPVLQASSAGTPTVAYCTQAYYAGHEDTAYPDPPANLQFVELNLNAYRSQVQATKVIKDYFMTSALRMTLQKPANQEPAKSYYAIADVLVEGRCECYGHAASCGGQNMAECVCEHQTTGRHCERCLPLYNNRAWQQGTTSLANACQLCNCNGHATSCHYDPALQYGMCDDCSNHTTGVNCSQCQVGYYINQYYNTTASAGQLCQGLPCGTYCIDCGCDGAGTEPAAQGVCQATSGQCTCKAYVTGVACDTCSDTYWGLRAENLQGCTPCSCDPAGSLNTTNYCNKTTGMCVCKNNTEGTRCERCKPQTFGFNATKTEGCTACDCDPGGSLNKECGNTPVVGQCPCRLNIEGRDCRQPAPGYFVPKMDYFLTEAEKGRELSPDLVERAGHGLPGATCSGRGFVSLLPGGSVVITINPTLSGLFDLVVRYEKTVVSTGLQVEVSLLGGASYECGGQSYPATAVWRFSADITQTQLRGASVLGDMCVVSGRQYRVNVTTNGVATLLVDSVFLLPRVRELLVFTTASQAEQDVMLRCLQDVMVKFPVDRVNCSSVEYSVMAQLIGGAIACPCPLGATCDPFTGDCPCPVGVLPPDCSACRVDHYDNNNNHLDGCIACACHVTGSVSPICNGTGVCRCRQNVVGTKCDACLPQYYGLQSGTGCSPCLCNMVYSVNNSCADTGACHCKPGVGGLLCDTCLAGYFNLSSEGCSPCECDVDGSMSATCTLNGVCACKSRVTGTKCDQCQPGYYGLGTWHPDGCITCYCTGHTTNCTTAEGWYNASVTSSWSLFDKSAVDARWGGQDGQGSNVTVVEDVDFERSISQAQYVMRMINSGSNLQHPMLYFSAPSLYLGDKRSSYGRHMSIRLHFSTTVDLIANHTGGDIILQGAYTDFHLVYTLPYLPENTTTTNYSVFFSESLWHVNTTYGPAATYSQMMLTLSMLHTLLIRGKFSNASDTVINLYGVELAHATRTAPPGNPTPITNVEQCFCPLPFGGDFCETCGAGFWRDSMKFKPTDTCSPCECNGHAGGPCSVTTGVCQCNHNTTGDHCNLCLPGFYGNALLGTPGTCQACMCPGSVPDRHMNVFASTCELEAGGQPQCINCSVGHGGSRCEVCLQGYYGTPANVSNMGGSCVACRCNGRAATCDSVTGMCVNCTSNTAGKECNVCASGYYGNAMTFTCRECQCKSAGATGECNDLTGQCVCKPNVMGFFCDQCVPNSYNYSSGNGCTPCDCHATGALRTSCDMTTGQCDCRLNVNGRRCEVCAATYWRLNLGTGCDPCNCSRAGTLEVAGEMFGTCDLDAGQCRCAREGIIGRTCDRCSTVSKLNFTYVTMFNIGTYPDCVLCGECFDQWALVIDSIWAEMAGLRNRTTSVWTHYGKLEAVSVNQTLWDVESKIQDAGESVIRVQNITQAMAQLSQKLQEIQNEVSLVGVDLGGLQQEFSIVQQNISSLATFTGQVTVDNDTVTTATLLRANIMEIITPADAAAQRSNSSWLKIQEYSELLESLTALSTQFSLRGQSAMQLLQVAVRTFGVADSIYNSTFMVSYTNNQQQLNNTQTLLQGLSTQLTELQQIVSTVQSEFTTANVTLNSVLVVSAALLRQWNDVALQLEDIAGNLTVMSDKVSLAYITVKQFEARVSIAVAKLKGAFQDVVEGLIIVRQLQVDIATAITTTTTISTITLRPLADMQQLVTSISNTVVSTEQVAQTSAKAQTALVAAQNIRAEMDQTLSQSQQVLEKVTTIQANIRDATTILTDAQNTHTANTGLNTTIHTATDVAKNVTSQLNSLVASTSAAVASTQGEITLVAQCLQAQRVEATSVGGQADLAYQQATTLQAQMALRAVMSEVTSQFTTNIDMPLANIRTAADLIHALQNNLATIQTPTRVIDVLTTYLTQVSTVEALQREVEELEVQLDALLNSLTIDATSAVCRG